jgi:hypothetical protein
MRITRLLTSVIVFFIFSSSALARQEISGDTKSNPALAGIKELSITLVSTDYEPNADALKPEDIKTDVIKQLYDAGFKIVRSSASAPELNIKLTFFKFDEQFIASVRTSLVRNVTLINDDERFSITADVWKMDAGLRIMAAEKIVDEVPAIVREQVRAFIAACPPIVSVDKRPDVNQPRQQLRKVIVEKDEKPVKQPAVEATFVASKNSQVFHKASCPSAKRISPNNLVSYAKRDEAIAAGKKPCQRCNP